jgi:hypothetical protein
LRSLLGRSPCDTIRFVAVYLENLAGYVIDTPCFPGYKSLKAR